MSLCVSCQHLELVATIGYQSDDDLACGGKNNFTRWFLFELRLEFVCSTAPKLINAALNIHLFSASRSCQYDAA